MMKMSTVVLRSRRPAAESRPLGRRRRSVGTPIVPTLSQVDLRRVLAGRRASFLAAKDADLDGGQPVATTSLRRFHLVVTDLHLLHDDSSHLRRLPEAHRHREDGAYNFSLTSKVGTLCHENENSTAPPHATEATPSTD